jgi:ABC-2 type transport system permease protein
MPEFRGNSGGIAPAMVSRTRPFYWSVRRELWEYRSIYMAPLALAGVVVAGFVFVLGHLPRTMSSVTALDIPHQREAVTQPFEVAASIVMMAAFIVSVYYALETLYGERRDRSILFWKSLPVSDLTTVLAKACVLLVVLPAVAFAVTLVMEAILVGMGCVVLAASGLSVAQFWTLLTPYDSMIGLLYHLATMHVLWYAPLYAWLLLISAWSRRAPLLWAAMPPFAIMVFERIAFHTTHFQNFLMDRVTGGSPVSGDMPAPDSWMMPLHFILTPGLWYGLFFAAAFLFIAARLRRARGPI